MQLQESTGSSGLRVWCFRRGGFGPGCGVRGGRGWAGGVVFGGCWFVENVLFIPKPSTFGRVWGLGGRVRPAQVVVGRTRTFSGRRGRPRADGVVFGPARACSGWRGRPRPGRGVLAAGRAECSRARVEPLRRLAAEDAPPSVVRRAGARRRWLAVVLGQSPARRSPG
ncbi:MAG: hypothetical protein E7Z94_09715 [Actinomyces ruminicola]|nr:hypothetical protein [Actinomyces ruminicola]